MIIENNGGYRETINCSIIRVMDFSILSEIG